MRTLTKEMHVSLIDRISIWQTAPSLLRSKRRVRAGVRLNIFVTSQAESRAQRQETSADATTTISVATIPLAWTSAPTASV